MAACGRFLSGPAGRVVHSFDGLPRRPEASQLRWSRHLVGRHLLQHVRQLGRRYRTPGLCQRRRLWWQMAATPAAICHCDTIERQFCAAGVGAVTVYGHVLAHMPRTDGPRGLVWCHVCWCPVGWASDAPAPFSHKHGRQRVPALPPAPAGHERHRSEHQVAFRRGQQIGHIYRRNRLTLLLNVVSTIDAFLWKGYLANKCFIAALFLYGQPEER